MSTRRNYISEARYTQLTGNTVSDSTEWDRRASIVEELIDDIVGPEPPFHHSRTVRLTEATIFSFKTNDFHSDQDDFYNGLRVRFVQGQGKDQETLISDYDAATQVFAMSPVLSTAPNTSTEVIVEQVGIFPRWNDRDADGRPRNPDALERAVAFAIAYTELVGGGSGVNAALFNTAGGKSSESIGSYSVNYDLGNFDAQREIGSRAYQILSNAGLINDTALHTV